MLIILTRCKLFSPEFLPIVKFRNTNKNSSYKIYFSSYAIADLVLPPLDEYKITASRGRKEIDCNKSLAADNGKTTVISAHSAELFVVSLGDRSCWSLSQFSIPSTSISTVVAQRFFKE